MKGVVIGTCMLLMLCVSGDLTLAASFDCAKAATKSEKLVCADPQVSAADEQLAEVYRRVLEQSRDKENLKKEQRNWVKTQRDVCPDAPCILKAYQARIAALEALEPTRTVVQLRSAPLTVAQPEAQQQFNVDANGRPRTYLRHKFDGQGEVVMDPVTSLTWQKSGSPNAMTYQDAQAYIAKLNQERFAGYSDWRLPMVDELLSLLTQAKQTHGLYLNPIFDATQTWCWSADKNASESVWGVGFSSGRLYRSLLYDKNYVRGVRP
jgi:uncharacterized protein